MRKICFLCAALLFLLSGCEKKRATAPARERFQDEIRLKTTPVKNQGGSSLCWVYAMLATIESEHLMQGDSVNLSADYLARTFIAQQAAQRIFAADNRPITTRGMAGMTLSLLATDGLHHHDAYHRKDDADYNVLCRKITRLTSLPSRNNFHERMNEVNRLLDDAIGHLPRKVFLHGAIYTPHEFARSVCRNNEYTGLTSFTHHPFGERFALEVPDNRFHDTFLNLPVDRMMSILQRSLRNGHPVCWEGDVSEPGFSFSRGIATLPAGTPTHQSARQKGFENHLTTDDHCMSIVGLSRNARGTKFFLCKNSWGKSNPHSGFMYLSYDYVKLKTIALYVQSEQISY